MALSLELCKEDYLLMANGIILRGPEIDKHINSTITLRLREAKQAKPKQKTVCFDFDGVLAYNKPGWPLNKIGRPLEKGFLKAKEEQDAGHRLVVLTARPKKYHAPILAYANRHGARYGVHFDAVTDKKVPALRYYDDRAEKVERNWGETKESKIDDWKKSILGHHQDIMVNPTVREAGIKGMRWRHKNPTRRKILEKTANALENAGWKYHSSFPDDFHHFYKTIGGKKHLLLVSDLGEWTHQVVTPQPKHSVRPYKLLRHDYDHSTLRDELQKDPNLGSK
jgi:hypothetical protein